MPKVQALSLPVARLGDVPRGIIAMIFASLFLAIASGITKYEVALYPTGEVLFVRSFASLLICGIFVLPVTGLNVFNTNILGAHAARGLSQSVSQAFTVLALGLMPLSSTIAINFSAPLWAALISVIWLRERPGPHALEAAAPSLLLLLLLFRFPGKPRQRLARGHGQERRQRRREAVAGAGKALVVDDLARRCAEAADRRERAAERRDDDVNVRDVVVVVVLVRASTPPLLLLPRLLAFFVTRRP